MPFVETTPRDLPPKLAPTTRIIEARGESNCVCGRPAISCGYCSAECLEREEAKVKAGKPDGSLASPTPNDDKLRAAHDAMIEEINRVISCIAYYGNDPSLNKRLITEHLDDLTRVLANAKAVK